MRREPFLPILSEKWKEKKKMTREEVLSQCLKERGGTVLCVGGGISDWNLPKSPLFIYWDDGSGGMKNLESKPVPSNVRGIAYGRWISHKTVANLRNAAKALHIPVFPMLKAREMKELLYGVEKNVDTFFSELRWVNDRHDHVDHVRESSEARVVEVEDPVIIHNEDAPAVLTKEDFLEKEKEQEMSPKKQPVKRGQLRAVVASLDDPSLKIGESAEKIFEYAKSKGVDTTFHSVRQSVSKHRMDKGIKPTRLKKQLTTSIKTSTKPPKKQEDPIQQAISLATEAKAALELLIEILPNISSEGDKLKKLRELLGV